MASLEIDFDGTQCWVRMSRCLPTTNWNGENPVTEQEFLYRQKVGKGDRRPSPCCWLQSWGSCTLMYGGNAPPLC